MFLVRMVFSLSLQSFDISDLMPIREGKCFGHGYLPNTSI